MPTRILLTEDNASLATLLEKFLTERGFQVTVATNGLEALREFTRGGIDLLVLDLRLPVVQGPEVLRRIRKTPQGATLPVVVMSGAYKGDRYVEAALQFGVRHYLEKPFRPADFLAAINDEISRIPVGPETAMMRLMADIYENRRTGVLLAAHAPPVFFIEGDPVSFTSRGRNEFASFLSSNGKLTRQEADTFSRSGEGRLFLTQAGFLTLDELIDQSRFFLTRHLAKLAQREIPGEFQEGSVDAEQPLVPLSLPALLYEMEEERQDTDWEAYLQRIQALYPARTRKFFRRINLLTLRGSDIDLLEMIDGKHRVSEVVQAVGGRSDAAAFIHFLSFMGMLELNNAPAAEAAPDFPMKNLFNRPLLEAVEESEGPGIVFDDVVAAVSSSVEEAVVTGEMAAPLTSSEIGFEQTVLRDYAFIKDKNYYELFGLTRQTFSFDALKDGYFGKTRQYSPEQFMELSGPTMTMAEEVLAVYAAAFSTLSNVVAKERYDELLNADTVGLDGNRDEMLQSKVQFQSGKVFLEMGEFENAEKSLQDAYTLVPDNASHCAFLAWAIYRNPTNRKSNASQEKARNLLARSLQLERTDDAYAFRGWMLLEEGREGLAESEFQKGLKINANHDLCRKGLRQIMEKREREKKGLLRRLFG